MKTFCTAAALATVASAGFTSTMKTIGQDIGYWNEGLMSALQVNPGDIDTRCY